MLRVLPIFLMFVAAACGDQSDEDALRDAANQSDPAAAIVLNGAAENGMDPQIALEQAGEAAAASNQGVSQSGSVQARPNTAENPNPPAAGEPPETTTANRQ